MKVQELGIEEMARWGATHRVTILPEDINGTGTGFGALSAAAAAATTGTVHPFGALAAGIMCQFVAGWTKTAFVPASATALTCTVNYDLASGTDKAAGYQTAVSICSGATPVSFFPVEIADASDTTTTQAGVNALIQQTRKQFGVANTVGVLFTSSTANLTDFVAAGELHLLFRLNDLTTQ